jgi:TPR repeat protein
MVAIELARLAPPMAGCGLGGDAMRLLTILLILCVWAAAVPAFAGPFEDAAAAYNKGDYTTAVRLLRPVAEKGDADAQYQLGRMYGSGEGVSQDAAAAMSWYRKAAEQGSADAQRLLGTTYEVGMGVPQDYETAVSWYRRAAEQGDSFSQYILGLKYGLGQGVPRDVVQAHKWLNLAATDANNIVVAVKARESLAAGMTPAQIAEAQKLAREWKPKPER